jgi:hypothetical protein
MQDNTLIKNIRQSITKNSVKFLNNKRLLKYRGRRRANFSLFLPTVSTLPPSKKTYIQIYRYIEKQKERFINKKQLLTYWGGVPEYLRIIHRIFHPILQDTFFTHLYYKKNKTMGWLR